MPTAVYLSLTDIAARLGLEASTVRTYRSQGRLPEPDAMTGPTPGWLPDTIDRWTANRPGQGVGGGRPRTPTARHYYEPGNGRHPMHTDPMCCVCGAAKNDRGHK